MTNKPKQTEKSGNGSKGLYLYAVIDSADGGKSDLGKIKGLGDKPLRAIAFKDIQAVVSDINGTKQQATRDNLLRHAAVQEEILKMHQLLPVRFGLIAESDEEIIHDLLEPHYDEFVDTLTKLKGKHELGLKVYWNQQAVLDNVVESDEKIKKLRDDLVARGNQKDGSLYQDKVELGRMIDEKVTSKREQLKEETLNSLASLAEEHRENKLMTENMVLNAAFLVNENKESEFEKKLNSLDEKYHDYLTFRFVPLAPPYNFVNINISSGAQR